MTEDIFSAGRLEMSDTPLIADNSALIWGEQLGTQIPAVLAILLFILMLKDIFRLIPSLIYAIKFPHGTSGLEYNLSVSRIRNRAALLCLLPFCLIADRYGLYRPDFWAQIPQQWSSCATLGIMAAFVLLRIFIYAAVRPRRMHNEEFVTLRHSGYNFFIACTIMMLLVSFIFSLAGVPDAISKVVIYVIMGIMALMSIWRSAYFLAANCGGLATILYLCGLEIVPMAMLVVSAVVF